MNQCIRAAGCRILKRSSKLALFMWSFHLAKHTPKISVTGLNPGSLLNTNMVKEAYGTFWSSADIGANIIHEIAVSAEHCRITGRYFDNDKGAYGEAHPDAYRPELVEQVVQTAQAVLLEQGFDIS